MRHLFPHLSVHFFQLLICLLHHGESHVIFYTVDDVIGQIFPDVLCYSANGSSEILKLEEIIFEVYW